MVAGAEVQNAMDLVIHDAMAKCKCEILLSQAVYQEVCRVRTQPPRVVWNPQRAVEWEFPQV